ncbi:hypothetical protein SH139x_001035 [Planctomycetaceae bacterium SH139]
MSNKIWIIAAVVATSSLLLDTNEAEAQGRSHYRYIGGNYTQTSQYVNYPVNRVYMVASPGYRVATIGSYPSYSVGFGNYNGYGYGYGYPRQSGYRSGYRGYSYPSRRGLSIGIGVGGFANRGYRDFGY